MILSCRVECEQVLLYQPSNLFSLLFSLFYFIVPKTFTFIGCWLRQLQHDWLGCFGENFFWKSTCSLRIPFQTTNHVEDDVMSNQRYIKISLFWKRFQCLFLNLKLVYIDWSKAYCDQSKHETENVSKLVSKSQLSNN